MSGSTITTIKDFVICFRCGHEHLPNEVDIINVYNHQQPCLNCKETVGMFSVETAFDFLNDLYLKKTITSIEDEYPYDELNFNDTL